MVKQRMDLLELLPSRRRQALRVLVDGIMDKIGAQHGERSPERVTYCNGYQPQEGRHHGVALREGSYGGTASAQREGSFGDPAGLRGGRVHPSGG